MEVIKKDMKACRADEDMVRDREDRGENTAVADPICVG